MNYRLADINGGNLRTALVFWNMKAWGITGHSIHDWLHSPPAGTLKNDLTSRFWQKDVGGSIEALYFRSELTSHGKRRYVQHALAFVIPE